MPFDDDAYDHYCTHFVLCKLKHNIINMMVKSDDYNIKEFDNFSLERIDDNIVVMCDEHHNHGNQRISLLLDDPDVFDKAKAFIRECIARNPQRN